MWFSSKKAPYVWGHTYNTSTDFRPRSLRKTYVAKQLAESPFLLWALRNIWTGPAQVKILLCSFPFYRLFLMRLAPYLLYIEPALYMDIRNFWSKFSSIQNTQMNILTMDCFSNPKILKTFFGCQHVMLSKLLFVI